MFCDFSDPMFKMWSFQGDKLSQDNVPDTTMEILYYHNCVPNLISQNAGDHGHPGKYFLHTVLVNLSFNLVGIMLSIRISEV